ncbi:uncharacterized protein LOC114416809 [Glycine soja]|uniref:uncharacterized protein LOC114416809 n=1 Tax=Glycine soja TaxID=3848 RepID=UPI00103C29EF|nr:uncharacterized protein LOC114416809 [Glycine soja]XP_028237633.1 uncharacterized protein LOC114416809 [Glycine soja]
MTPHGPDTKSYEISIFTALATKSARKPSPNAKALGFDPSSFLSVFTKYQHGCCHLRAEFTSYYQFLDSHIIPSLPYSIYQYYMQESKGNEGAKELWHEPW